MRAQGGPVLVVHGGVRRVPAHGAEVSASARHAASSGSLPGISCRIISVIAMGSNQNHRISYAVPLILPSLCRQPPRIRAHNGELSRMRIRRWRACTNKCEPSRTGLHSPCKRKVVSSILTGGSTFDAGQRPT